MRGIFLGHAGWLANAGGRRILFDPWFAEPVFARAWWRYPPPPFPTLADLAPVDALVVSHILLGFPIDDDDVSARLA